MNNSSTGIKKRHAEFLQALYNLYGNVASVATLSEIAVATNNIVSTTINYLERLEKYGYITIARISARKKQITINETMYKRLMNEVSTLYK